MEEDLPLFPRCRGARNLIAFKPKQGEAPWRASIECRTAPGSSVRTLRTLSCKRLAWAKRRALATGAVLAMSERDVPGL